MADYWTVVQIGTTHPIMPPGLPVAVLPVVPSAYPYTAVNGDFVEASAAAGAVTVDLDSSAPVGSRLVVKKIDATANYVNVDGGSTMIDGTYVFSLTAQYDALTLVRGTTQWWVE